MNTELYEFGDFLLDVGQKQLRRNGEKVPLQPKVFEILVLFLQRRDKLLGRDEIMQAIWGDVFVEESNLRFCIHALRKVLGDGYVETVPKRGYRFTADVREKNEEVLPTKSSRTEITDEIPPPLIIEKKQSSNRVRIYGIAALSVICLLVLTVVFTERKSQKPNKPLGINQLAVLPFETIGEKERELQIGLTDSMIRNLGKIENLKILPIDSVRRFAGQNFDASQIGKELEADAILTGNFRSDGENVRATVNLLRVSDNAALWTETFTVKGKSDFERENSIALRTARLLWLKITEAEDERIFSNQKLDAEAVQNYLSARKIWRTNELFRRKEMIGLFEKAIALEPNWALAQTGYAESLLTADNLSAELEKAEKLAEKAVEVDNLLAQPHTILGEIYHFRDWNWEKAESEFKQAIALNPNYALTYFKYSEFLRLQRRFAEAETELKKAIEIEPFSPVFYTSLCQLYYFDGKTDKALEACNYARQIEPDYWLISKTLYWIYVERKMYAELGEMALGKLSPNERAANPLTKALAENDLRSFWQYLIDEPSKSGNAKIRPVVKAMLHLQIGEKEKALVYLETALEQHDEILLTVNADSAFDSIRSEKRFNELMRKIGLQK